MNRRVGSVAVLVLLLPGVWLAEQQTVVFSVPAELPIQMSGTFAIDLSVLLFTAIPTLFILFMIVEATGHIRERKPPS